MNPASSAAVGKTIPSPTPLETRLHILHVFSTFAVGGPQRRFVQIARRLGARYRHSVRAMDGRTDAAALLEGDSACDVRPLEFARSNMLGNIVGARRLLKKLRPDVLVTYNWGATEWAAANHPRVARHIHIEDGFGPEEAKTRLLRRAVFRRLVLGQHSTVVVPSQTLKRIALEEWRLDPKQVNYVPNGIPCLRFQREADPEVTGGFRGHGPVIGTVATLRREKALDRLIGAYAQVQARMPARLVIVGDGPDRERLEALAATSGLCESITFTGALDEPERILRSFDVFAMSSDTEQMPLSLLEAMAAGRPVVSTDAGDIAAMVAAENRPFIVPKSELSLAEAMIAVLSDSAARYRMGAANEERARREFDETRMVESYDRLFAGA